MLLGRLSLPLGRRPRNWVWKSPLESLDHGPKTGYRPERRPHTLNEDSERARECLEQLRKVSCRIQHLLDLRTILPNSREAHRRISSLSLASCWSKSTSWFSRATVSKVALKLRKLEIIFLMVPSGP